MSHATDDLKKALDDTVSAIEEVRDEMKLKLHLAQMEAKDRWNEIEPTLLEARAHAKRVADKLDEVRKILAAP